MNNTTKNKCEGGGMNAGMHQKPHVDAGSPKRETLREEEGQAVYDTRRLAPGSYTVELVNAGKHIGAQKLVVRP